MINILFIHQSADLYGSDKTLLQLLTYLDRTKFNPVVVIPINGPLKDELEKVNIEVFITPVLKLYRNIVTPKNGLKFFSEYKKAIHFLDEINEKHKFDIIYSNTLAVLLGMIYAKKRKIKHIWHVHEIIVHPKIIANFFPKLLNKYADSIVCNSIATLNNLTQRIPQIKDKSIVIYNGVEPINEVKTSVCKTDFGFKTNDIIITLVGRIYRLKGHKLLLSSFIKQFSNQENVKLLFVGSPVIGQEKYLYEVEKIIKTNLITDKVKILPFTKNLNSIWQITDIAVMPSTEAESFGLVAVEAMMAKKPVIGSNHGGLTEIIINNKTGLLFEPNNENELSEAIQYLIDHPKERLEIGENGKNSVIEKFSITSYIQNFENLFLTLK
jgi:glycosyltransferase involved in cell wall biosynthesis